MPISRPYIKLYMDAGITHNIRHRIRQKGAESIHFPHYALTASPWAMEHDRHTAKEDFISALTVYKTGAYDLVHETQHKAFTRNDYLVAWDSFCAHYKEEKDAGHSLDRHWPIETHLQKAIHHAQHTHEKLTRSSKNALAATLVASLTTCGSGHATQATDAGLLPESTVRHAVSDQRVISPIPGILTARKL